MYVVLRKIIAKQEIKQIFNVLIVKASLHYSKGHYDASLLFYISWLKTIAEQILWVVITLEKNN